MYFLVNQYMMGIQAGIQAGHAACRLLGEYWEEDPSNRKRKLIEKWLTEDETFIILDGGYQKRMYDFMGALLKTSDRFPYTAFHEEEESLNGALTAVAFILPDYIYEAVLDENGEAPGGIFRKDTLEYLEYSEDERNLIEKLKSFHLKRG